MRYRIYSNKCPPPKILLLKLFSYMLKLRNYAWNLRNKYRRPRAFIRVNTVCKYFLCLFFEQNWFWDKPIFFIALVFFNDILHIDFVYFYFYFLFFVMWRRWPLKEHCCMSWVKYIQERQISLLLWNGLIYDISRIFPLHLKWTNLGKSKVE